MLIYIIFSIYTLILYHVICHIINDDNVINFFIPTRKIMSRALLDKYRLYVYSSMLKELAIVDQMNYYMVPVSVLTETSR